MGELVGLIFGSIFNPWITYHLIYSMGLKVFKNRSFYFTKNKIWRGNSTLILAIPLFGLGLLFLLGIIGSYSKYPTFTTLGIIIVLAWQFSKSIKHKKSKTNIDFKLIPDGQEEYLKFKEKIKTIELSKVVKNLENIFNHPQQYNDSNNSNTHALILSLVKKEILTQWQTIKDDPTKENIIAWFQFNHEIRPILFYATERADAEDKSL